MKKHDLLRFGALALAIGVAPFTMWGSLIQGTTAGKTVKGAGIDDFDTATTFDITYQTSCPWIVTGAGRFPAYNFVFAGQGVASDIKNIDPGDFTISQYNPWVVDNNRTTNNITSPEDPIPGRNNTNINRNVTGQDAGGANIVVSYTPLNRGDPTNVNFVQAFIQNTNGAGFTTGVMDSGATPYYNGDATSGTGTRRRTGTIPLVTDSTTAAWLVDIPYRCENGAIVRCIGGADDTLLSQVQYFQTFIEEDRTIKGTKYNVLFGGVQWGYSFTAVETPEPSSILLVGFVLAAGLLSYRRLPFRHPHET
jgi:hypothetical protein